MKYFLKDNTKHIQAYMLLLPSGDERRSWCDISVLASETHRQADQSSVCEECKEIRRIWIEKTRRHKEEK